MGYTTSFINSFTLDKPLTDIQIEYLNMFADTRRMKRDSGKLHAMFVNGQGNKRCFELCIALGLPIDGEGEFYCGTGPSGQDGGHFNSSDDNSVVEYNYPPSTQPGLWNQWNPNEDGTEIIWDGSEKFYNYIEWIKYLINTFLAPWGYKVNGQVEWRGEDNSDIGVLEVVDNVVTTHEGKTIAHLEDARKNEKMTESAIAASNDFAESKAKSVGIATETSEIILDIVKLRNELVKSKKGTAIAAKKLDDIIKKYGV